MCVTDVKYDHVPSSVRLQLITHCHMQQKDVWMKDEQTIKVTYRVREIKSVSDRVNTRR